MISRRILRVKTMQAGYAFEQEHEPQLAEAQKALRYNIEQTYSLILYCVYAAYDTVHYAHKVASVKKEKHIASDEERQFDTRIADDSMLQQIYTNPAFADFAKSHKFQYIETDDSITKKLFELIQEMEEYHAFLQDSASIKTNKALILAIIKKCFLKNEIYTHVLEDNFLQFNDDQGIILNGAKSFLDFYDKGGDFVSKFLNNLKEEQSFGTSLLAYSIDESVALTDMICQKLTNWDEDRVALIDMILMRMAICELLHFPEIPVKVTINEYIEISKNYSTPKSKDFINGILDNIKHELIGEGRIKKSGRGLVE